MRPAARGYASLISTARSRVLWRGGGTHLFSGRSSSIASGSSPQRVPFRPIHLLSQRGLGQNGLSGAAWTSPTRSTGSSVAGASREQLGQTQTRFFRKANYVEKMHDNEKTGEVLEALEVRDDEKDTQPQWQVLGADGEKPSSEGQDAKRCEDLTKGKKGLFSGMKAVANLNRKNVDDAIATFQIDHSLDYSW